MLQKTCYKETNYSQYTDIRHRNETFQNFILNVSEKCADLIVSCTFHQQQIPCTDIFREIFVDEGLCCIFNFLHPYYLYKFKFGFSKKKRKNNLKLNLFKVTLYSGLHFVG